MSAPSVLRLTLSLSPLVIALALAMDVYVPAIPNMTKIFHVSDNVMLLTLSAFMMTAGLMQLVVGPIADSYGRRFTAGIAVAIYSLGCILCALSSTTTLLIGARVIQAIGSAALLVVGFTVVRDCYEGAKSARVYSYLNGIISFSPMFAPFIGSYLDIYLGWQATFLCLLVISLAVIISLLFSLPETLPIEKRQPLVFKESVKQYRAIFFNKTFAIYNLATSFGLSYLYLFCAMSPYLIIRDLNIPESHYGLYFCYMGISFFLGSTFCSLIVERIGVFYTCIAGFILTLIGGLAMATWYALYGLTLHGFIYPMLLVGIGGTFCMGAGNGGGMQPFSENTGAAAALGGTLRFSFSSLVGYLVINDHVASTLPLGLPAILFSLTGLLLFFCYRAELKTAG